MQLTCIGDSHQRETKRYLNRTDWKAVPNMHALTHLVRFSNGRSERGHRFDASPIRTDVRDRSRRDEERSRQS